MSEDSKEETALASFEELMGLITKLGNHELVAQTRYSLEYDGIKPTPEFCTAAFIGAALVAEMAERAHEAETISTVEMVATQEVSSLVMQIWATLHEQLVTGII